MSRAPLTMRDKAAILAAEAARWRRIERAVVAATLALVALTMWAPAIAAVLRGVRP